MRRRELNHAETIVETNSKGQCLCRPKYGCHWTIVTPTRNQPGMNCVHWIGEELSIKAQWNAHYADMTPVDMDNPAEGVFDAVVTEEGESVWDW